MEQPQPSRGLHAGELKMSNHGLDVPIDCRRPFVMNAIHWVAAAMEPQQPSTMAAILSLRRR